MIEPRRLRTDGDSRLQHALLEEGASYRSSPRARAKTLAALGLAGSATAASTAASSSLLAKLGGIKLVLLVVAASAIPTGYYGWHWYRHLPASAASALVARPADPLETPPGFAPATPPGPATAPAPALDTSLDPVDLPPEPSSGSARQESRAAGPIAAAPSIPAAGSDLGGEIDNLDKARSALAGGDAPSALSLLERYSRAFPHGRLELEAEVLRIDALAKNGQLDAAKKRASAFVRRHPNGVLSAHVRRYLIE